MADISANWQVVLPLSGKNSMISHAMRFIPTIGPMIAGGHETPF
jgi:hypothetical protein